MEEEVVVTSLSSSSKKEGDSLDLSFAYLGGKTDRQAWFRTISPFYYGSKQPDASLSQHLMFHFPSRSEVSEQASEQMSAAKFSSSDESHSHHDFPSSCHHLRPISTIFDRWMIFVV